MELPVEESIGIRMF